MKLFLDTADSAQIKQWKDTGIVDGITTNPTHLSKAGDDPKRRILEICALLPNGDISVEVTEHDPEMVYKQAREIAALSDTITVKIPCHIQYYSVIKKLVDQGIRINITLVFTLIQGLMMCKLGVRYISPFVGRWDDTDVEGTTLLEELRYMIDTYGYETQILAASLRTVRHLHYAIIAGSDVATVPVSLLKKSVDHILTDKGMELFDADWKKLGIKQFP